MRGFNSEYLLKNSPVIGLEICAGTHTPNNYYSWWFEVIEMNRLPDRTN